MDKEKTSSQEDACKLALRIFEMLPKDDPANGVVLKIVQGLLEI